MPRLSGCLTSQITRCVDIATLNLLARFRSREIADSHLDHMDDTELRGFQYPGVEHDLRPVLSEREATSSDVLECAVRLIQSWNLTSMSDDLAELMLDGTAPLEVRKAAGYALVRIGTDEAKRRILPLTTGRPDDPTLDLKGPCPALQLA